MRQTLSSQETGLASLTFCRQMFSQEARETENRGFTSGLTQPQDTTLTPSYGIRTWQCKYPFLLYLSALIMQEPSHKKVSTPELTKFRFQISYIWLYRSFLFSAAPLQAKFLRVSCDCNIDGGWWGWVYQSFRFRPLKKNEQVWYLTALFFVLQIQKFGLGME